MSFPDPDGEDTGKWRKLALLAGLCGIFGLAGLVSGWLDGTPPWLPPVFFILSMIAGGWNAARDAGPSVLTGKLDIDFLMLAVAVGASLIGAYGEGALLLFLFSSAGALEHFALHRTRREIQGLFHLQPKTASRLNPETGQEEIVAISQIRRGDSLLVRPGDTFPVDGKITEGESAADESSLTGEAMPVDKGKGREVYSGTLNLWGALKVQCLRPANESSLQKIIRLIQDARHQRAPSQRLTDRFGPRYTLGVLGVTSLMFFVWWLGFGVSPFLNQETATGTSFSAFYRAMTLLVVASPCALVLSIPSAILAAIAWGARHGILFRGGAAIEQLAQIEIVALDKTGTLTTGDLRLETIESFPPGREQHVLQAAYTLEQNSSHPIARAIRNHGDQESVTPLAMSDFRNLTGKGVHARIEKEAAFLGRRELLKESSLGVWDLDLPPPPSGLIEVWLLQGELLGRILLQDTVRRESREVLAALHRNGIKTVMLTGDRREVAEAIGHSVGIGEIRAGLSPEDKVAAVRELAATGRRVAMVGDGINDAPSLAAADIAVAMGARGSDAALEQSDLVLMNDKIENFFEAFKLSRRARRIIQQNVVISLGTILIMVSAAFLGILPISIGVLAHEGSTVVVCLNSLRLLAGKREKPAALPSGPQGN
jgi:Cd2+/Zn2+-exporting ATPase